MTTVPMPQQGFIQDFFLSEGGNRSVLVTYTSKGDLRMLPQEIFETYDI